MSSGMQHLLSRLERFGALGDRERQALSASLSAPRHFAPREELLQERRRADCLFVLGEGFACRYKLLADGRRPILGLLLPGDLCDLRMLVAGQIDHSVSALSALSARTIPAGSALALLDRHPRLARALWGSTAVEDCIAREWLVNVGHRTAFERVAHLCCEVFWRLEARGLTRQNSCELPLTQIELGDTLALSAVHVNRTLMYMRRASLVRVQGGRLELLDRRGLQAAAGFDPAYLHLDGAAPAARTLPAKHAASARPSPHAA